MDRLVKLTPINIIIAGSCMDMILRNAPLLAQVPPDTLADLQATRDLFWNLKEENNVILEG